MLLIAAFAVYVIVTKRLRISRATVVTGTNARNFGICLLVLLIPFQVMIGAVLNVVLPRSARVWPIPQTLFVIAFTAIVLIMAYYFRDLERAQQSAPPPSPEPEPQPQPEQR
jgi:hypothetical protein